MVVVVSLLQEEVSKLKDPPDLVAPLEMVPTGLSASDVHPYVYLMNHP
jgi:hypothetical protein